MGCLPCEAFGPVAPATPQDKALWINSSSGPPYQLEVWNAGAAAWQAVGIVAAGTGPGALTVAQAQLGANVAMGSANTFFDGPALSLAAGTWIVWATLTVAASSVQQITARLHAGATNYASAEVQTAATETVLALVAVVTLGATTTVAAAAANQSANTTIRAATPDNAAGNTASTIVALKVA